MPCHINKAVLSNASATKARREAAVVQKDSRDTAKARNLLLEHFPDIPSHDLEKILGHAFLKGSRRVGRSGTVRNERAKFHLAVEAHIRHEHTTYETLLEKNTDRGHARHLVWRDVKSIKARWMGHADAEDGVDLGVSDDGESSELEAEEDIIETDHLEDGESEDGEKQLEEPFEAILID